MFCADLNQLVLNIVSKQQCNQTACFKKGNAKRKSYQRTQKWFDYFLFVGSSLHATEKTRHIHLLHDVTWFSVESTLPWLWEIRIQDNINIQPPFPSIVQHRLLGYSYQVIRSREQGIRMKEYLRWDGWLHVVMEGQMASAQKRTEPACTRFTTGTSLPQKLVSLEAPYIQQP